MKFEPGETVFAVDFRSKGTWVEGVIEEISNSIAWIKLQDGRRIRRHINHIRNIGSYQRERNMTGKEKLEIEELLPPEP